MAAESVANDAESRAESGAAEHDQEAEASTEAAAAPEEAQPITQDLPEAAIAAASSSHTEVAAEGEVAAESTDMGQASRRHDGGADPGDADSALSGIEQQLQQMELRVTRDGVGKTVCCLLGS